MKWSISCRLCDCFCGFFYRFHTSPLSPSQLWRKGPPKWNSETRPSDVCWSYLTVISELFLGVLDCFCFLMTLRLISHARGKSYLFGVWWVDWKTNTGYLFRNASWAYSRRGCSCCQTGLFCPPSSLSQFWLCPSLPCLLPFFGLKRGGAELVIQYLPNSWTLL